MDKSNVPVIYLMLGSGTLFYHPSGTLATPEELSEIIQKLLLYLSRAKRPPL